MARPRGTRSQNYVERRDELLAKVGAALAGLYPVRPSLRDLAEAAGVSQPTLRHYFGNRDGVIAAHLERFGGQGAPYLARLREPEGALPESLAAAARNIVIGLTLPGLATEQAAALGEGLAGAGPGYIAHVLEPLVEAVRARLAAHIDAGDMRPADTRAVALQLVSPLFVAALHQLHLGGAKSHPLDMEALARHVSATLARAHGADTETPGQ
jgi:AcrR family transcriptional regulator